MFHNVSVHLFVAVAGHKNGFDYYTFHRVILFSGPGSEMLLPTVVVNGMLYDGCVERACLDLGLPCVSQTDKQVYFNTALTITKNRILAMWKDGEGVMADKLPRYRAEIDEDTLPRPVQEPELKICTLLDGTLCLPRDTRDINYLVMFSVFWLL